MGAGGVTLLSIGLNILHAPTDPLPRLLAAIPPIALFLSFELLMNQVKSIARRLGSVQTLRELDTAVRQKQADLDKLIATKKAEMQAVMAEMETGVSKLETQVDRLGAKKEELLNELKQLRQEIRSEKAFSLGKLDDANAVRTSQKQQQLEDLLTYLTEHPDASLNEMASAIDRSKTTASNYVTELTTNGRLHKNGHGWEVLDTP